MRFYFNRSSQHVQNQRFYFKRSMSACPHMVRVLHVRMLFPHQGCMCSAVSRTSQLCLDRPAFCSHLIKYSFEKKTLRSCCEPFESTRSQQSSAQPSWASMTLQTDVCVPLAETSTVRAVQLWKSMVTNPPVSQTRRHPVTAPTLACCRCRSLPPQRLQPGLAVQPAPPPWQAPVHRYGVLSFGF